MSRRKQTRPRPVKEKLTDSIPWIYSPDRINLSNDRISLNTDNFKLLGRHHAEGGNAEPETKVKSAGQVENAPFLLKDLSSAVRNPAATPFYPLVEKQSPEHRAVNSGSLCPVVRSELCHVCVQQQQAGLDLRCPVEGRDYFIDADGTLAIRNGVCPRKLALALFSQVSGQRSKYVELLGENLFKFVLNLKQIVKEHKLMCPGEKDVDVLKAKTVLSTFSLVQGQLSKSLVTQGSLQVTSESGTMRCDTVSSNTSGNSLSTSNASTAVKSYYQQNLVNILAELPSTNVTSFGVVDYADMAKSSESDNCSNESTSRVVSPSPSFLSSETSGPNIPDRNRQLANTKRGCKILPVASNNGQSHYICPICNLELSSDHELTIHIRSHNQTGHQATPNTCTICGKTLSSQSSLDRHMLVHSGERPFKCKICDMSFTTNGNMHRHARIHDKKNGISAPKLSGRKLAEHKITPEDNLSYQDEKSQAESIGQKYPVPSLPDLGSQHTLDSRAFLQHYYRFMFPNNGSHHPAFPYTQLMGRATGMTFPYLQTLIDPTSAEYLHAINSLVRPPREPSPDLRVANQFYCSVCTMSFTNQFSLEAHMESHIIVDEKLEAESCSACKECKTVVKSEASLLLHSLKHHRAKDEGAESFKMDPAPSLPPSAESRSVGASSSGHVKSGISDFQNLGFANFTGKKFPLMVKAFCENNPKTNAFKPPVYKCDDCSMEFPVEGAKHLHEASHVPEEYTMCPQCNCHFSEPSRLQEHMQKHVADLKFEESCGTNDVTCVGDMGQDNFLAQLGLFPREEHEEPCSKVDSENADTCIRDRMVNSDDENRSTDSSSDEDSRTSLCQTQVETPLREIKTRPDIVVTPRLKHPSTSSNSQPFNSGSLSLHHRIPSSSPSEARENVPSKFKNVPTHPPDSTFGADNMQPLIICKYCNIEFIDLKGLKYHQCSQKNTPLLQCKICHYSSSDKNTLLRHMRTHSGERPYKCAVCEYSFTTKANCERHLRQKHGLDKNQMSDKMAVNKYIIANRSRSAYLSASDISGWEKGVLSRSRPEPRSEPRPNHPTNNCICRLCRKSFRTYSSVVQHIALHHPGTNLSEVDTVITCTDNDSESIEDSQLPSLITPPPAHLKSPISSCQSLNGRHDMEQFAKQLNVLLTRRHDLTGTGPDGPLDFSQQLKSDTSSLPTPPNGLHKQSEASSDDSSDYVPVDLSLPKPSNSSPETQKSLDQNFRKQKKTESWPGKCQKQTSEVESDLSAADDDDDDDKASDARNISVGLMTAEETVARLAKTNNEDVNKSRRCFNLGELHSEEKKFNKTSSSESDSGCELASVNRILDATDAQKFQSFLHIPETEDEQEMDESEPEASDEDSSNSVYTSMLSKALKDQRNEKITGDKNKSNSNTTCSDPNNMSEQAIAELIEKVSQENGVSPAKKKKNSYADSPHKFFCPHCTRCFPWLSSLNRHLLTHTGQKPFKCPRCPVTFSTKSNRERHLIRKHNVNMLDPASRATMDRPFKCHIYNLIKHYKDKHEGVAIPGPEVHLDKSSSDWEDKGQNSSGASCEDEEEDDYTSYVQVQETMTDKEVMLENYVQENNNNILSTSNGGSRSNGSSKSNDSCDLNLKLNREDAGATSIDNNSRHVRPTSASDQHNQSVAGEGEALKEAVGDHKKNLVFPCAFCEDLFDMRVECLQHLEKAHEKVWAVMKAKNDIGNIQVFSARLGKTCDKLGKKGRDAGYRAEEGHVNLEMTSDSSKMKQPSLTFNGCEKKSENLKDKETIISSDVLCAVCPERLKSLQDLRRHMNCHIGLQKSISSFEKFSSNLNGKLQNLKQPIMPAVESKIVSDGPSVVDLLPNLLGVTSSTIDQIFESSGSAASLLGV